MKSDKMKTDGKMKAVALLVFAVVCFTAAADDDVRQHCGRGLPAFPALADPDAAAGLCGFRLGRHL